MKKLFIALIIGVFTVSSLLGNSASAGSGDKKPTKHRCEMALLVFEDMEDFPSGCRKFYRVCNEHGEKYYLMKEDVCPEERKCASGRNDRCLCEETVFTEFGNYRTDKDIEREEAINGKNEFRKFLKENGEMTPDQFRDLIKIPC